MRKKSDKFHLCMSPDILLKTENYEKGYDFFLGGW